MYVPFHAWFLSLSIMFLKFSHVVYMCMCVCACVCVCVQSLSQVQLFCSPMDYSPPGSSVSGIFQARILEWVAISSSRESPRPRDGAHSSPALQADSLPLSHVGSPLCMINGYKWEALRFSFYNLWLVLFPPLGNTQPTLKNTPNCLIKLQATKVKLIT